MKYLSKYDIAFKGLKEGKHRYEFDIDDWFFEKFSYSEVQKGKLKATVDLTKQSALMILEMAVKGTVELQCDRCLEEYPQELKHSSKMFIKFGAETEEMSDDVIVISNEENQFNVAQYLYELIILGLPIKHVHPNNKKGINSCNPEMIKKLNEYLVDEEEEEQASEPEDQRWQALKKLLDNK